MRVIADLPREAAQEPPLLPVIGEDDEEDAGGQSESLPVVYEVAEASATARARADEGEPRYELDASEMALIRVQSSQSLERISATP